MIHTITRLIIDYQVDISSTCYNLDYKDRDLYKIFLQLNPACKVYHIIKPFKIVFQEKVDTVIINNNLPLDKVDRIRLFNFLVEYLKEGGKMLIRETRLSPRDIYKLSNMHTLSLLEKYSKENENILLYEKL